MERLLAEIETEKNKFSDSLLKQVNLTDISNAMRQTQKVGDLHFRIHFINYFIL